MPVITIENLKYKYPGTDRLALDGISLSIEKGEFIGIAGQNGAGKSTLCQAIVGLVPQFYHGAYGGTVKVKERLADQVKVQEMCEDVGFIFQNPFNQLSGAKDTVYGEVAYGLQNLGIEREEMKSRIEKVMTQLDIWQYRDRNPFDLSGGQMQRVAIASILVMQPDVIILDEPTSQLDPEGTEEVFRVVDQLSKTGKTIIMIEHKLEKMAKYCDRIILMHDGKVVDFDTPEKIFAREDLEELGVKPPIFVPLLERQEKLSDLARKLKREKKHTVQEQEEVFRIENLSFSYQKNMPVIENLNLPLDHRTTAIIGQNGAGKTTFVRLLKGLLKPVTGSIYFGGDDISGKTVAMLAGKVGYVFQNPDDQIFKYNVLDEVMFGPLNIGMSPEKAVTEAKKALEMMGLSGKEKENPYDLEIYERKMVAIASVIAMDTDVVILDEPTIAQDYPGKKRIGAMIEKLSGNGKLVIAILHDMDFVYENFDRVIVMAHGAILADGTSEEVFKMHEVLKEARLEKPYMLQLFERFHIE